MIPQFNVVRFAAALAAGLLCGFGFQHWREVTPAGQSGNSAHAVPSVPSSDSAAKRNAASAWVQELQRLSPAEYPAYTMAWHAQFSLIAAAAIERDPRAAMAAFSAAPQFHRQGCVEIFTELLCQDHPVLALELAEKLPAVFSETVRYAVPGNVARLDPAMGLEMARHGPFAGRDLAFNIAGGGMARSGDVRLLTFLRQSLQGKELESALIGFADELGRTKPAEAVAAAAGNPDIAKRLLDGAGYHFWLTGDTASAFDCLAKADRTDAPDMLKNLVDQSFQLPPNALMPAWQRFLELSRTDPSLMTPQQLEIACTRLAHTLSDRDSGQLAAFTAATPEGPLREVFSRYLRAAKNKQGPQ